MANKQFKNFWNGNGVLLFAGFRRIVFYKPVLPRYNVAVSALINMNEKEPRQVHVLSQWAHNVDAESTLNLCCFNDVCLASIQR